MTPAEIVRRIIECDNGRDKAGYRALLHDDYLSMVHGEVQNTTGDAEADAAAPAFEEPKEEPKEEEPPKKEEKKTKTQTQTNKVERERGRKGRRRAVLAINLLNQEIDLRVFCVRVMRANERARRSCAGG